jgi:hypothetical protein
VAAPGVAWCEFDSFEMVGKLRQSRRAKTNSKISGVNPGDQIGNRSSSGFGIGILFYCSDYSLAMMRFPEMDLSDQRSSQTSGPRFRFFLIKLQFCISSSRTAVAVQGRCSPMTTGDGTREVEGPRSGPE